MPDGQNVPLGRSEIIGINFPFALPRLIEVTGHPAARDYLEFFTTLPDLHTRRAYARASVEFLGWCSLSGVVTLGAVQTFHVETWIERLSRRCGAPMLRKRLAGVRHLFDWLKTRGVVPSNPAATVRGLLHGVERDNNPFVRGRCNACRVRSTCRDRQDFVSRR